MRRLSFPALALLLTLGCSGGQPPSGNRGGQSLTPVGPAGPQGVQGPVGPQGPQGPAGQQGPAGARGVAGATGDRGPAGPSSIAALFPPHQTCVTRSGNNVGRWANWQYTQLGYNNHAQPGTAVLVNLYCHSQPASPGVPPAAMYGVAITGAANCYLEASDPILGVLTKSGKPHNSDATWAFLCFFPGVDFRAMHPNSVDNLVGQIYGASTVTCCL